LHYQSDKIYIEIMETRRQLQSGELIKRNFSMVLQQEGQYVYGQSILVSVTKVMMTPDLALAKIFLSIFNTENKGAVLIMMNEHKHRLKQQLAQRIKKHVRRMPYIDFYIDDTLDEMYKINQLFDEIKKKEGEI
jgi:ribosome-binding factor A